ncbi:hypothetical protein [Chitinophaga barathri]|uniref:hypothetical protein n=1 Tax=Chitinophaga barathri TaxID=1647451 RepID=UPI0016176562|nr:hypothetical protein [Chitinophaga barathri]
MKRHIGWKILAAIVCIPAFAALFGFATMYLWNWLVPALFNGPVITFWQALGLLILCKLLFGFPKGGHHEKKKHWRWNKERWREHMKTKMEHLSPEEKEKVKNHFDRCMTGRWGFKTREEAPGTTEE